MRTIQEVDQRIAEMKEELDKLEWERYKLSEENESYFLGIRYEDDDWSNRVEFKRFGLTTEDKVIDWVNAGNEQEDNDDFPYITYQYKEITEEQNDLFYDFECVCKMVKASKYRWENERLNEACAIIREEHKALEEKINVKELIGYYVMAVDMIDD